jgi:hypothetical protein
MRKLGWAALLVAVGALFADWLHLRREHAALKDSIFRALDVGERVAEVNRAQSKALVSCRATLDTEVDLAQARLMSRLNITKAQQKAYKKKFGRDFRQDELDSYVLTSLREFNGDHFTP